MNKSSAYTYPAGFANVANFTPGVPRLKSHLVKITEDDDPEKVKMPKNGYAPTLKGENKNVGQYPTLPVYEPLHPWVTVSGTGYGHQYWLGDRTNPYNY